MIIQIFERLKDGCVAQLVEHRLCKAGVAGSRPVASTLVWPLEIQRNDSTNDFLERRKGITKKGQMN